MRIRNAFIHPPFIMFYLTFTLPAVQAQLQQHGFDVTVRPLGSLPGLPEVWSRQQVVTATRPTDHAR
jgi:hypothetical protein